MRTIRTPTCVAALLTATTLATLLVAAPAAAVNLPYRLDEAAASVKARSGTGTTVHAAITTENVSTVGDCEFRDDCDDEPFRVAPGQCLDFYALYNEVSTVAPADLFSIWVWRASQAPHQHGPNGSQNWSETNYLDVIYFELDDGQDFKDTFTTCATKNGQPGGDPVSEYIELQVRVERTSPLLEDFDINSADGGAPPDVWRHGRAYSAEMAVGRSTTADPATLDTPDVVYQGQSIALTTTLLDLQGRPIYGAAQSLEMFVTAPNRTDVAGPLTPDEIGAGTYVQNWTVPTDAPTGCNWFSRANRTTGGTTAASDTFCVQPTSSSILSRVNTTLSAVNDTRDSLGRDHSGLFSSITSTGTNLASDHKTHESAHEDLLETLAASPTAKLLLVTILAGLTGIVAGVRYNDTLTDWIA